MNELRKSGFNDGRIIATRSRAELLDALPDENRLTALPVIQNVWRQRVSFVPSNL